MEYTLSSPTLFGGLAVAQGTLDVAVRPTAEPWQVGNEAAGLRGLVAPLGSSAPVLVVLAAPGGFAGPLLAALAVAAGPVVRVNPRQVRAFAPAIGLLAKTDRIDARGLAHLADALKPVPRALPDAATQAVRALLPRRRHVVERLTAERPRLGTVPPRRHQTLR
jgi:transposase